MGSSDRVAFDPQGLGFKASDYTVCPSCVHDSGLREAIQARLTEPTCSFCDVSIAEGASTAAPFHVLMIPVMEAAAFVYLDPTVNFHFDDDAVDPVNYNGEIFDSRAMIRDLCERDVAPNVLAAIADTVENRSWTTSDVIQLPLHRGLRKAWDRLCAEVKYRSRFVFLVSTEESTGYPQDYTAPELLSTLANLLRKNALREVPAGRLFWRGRLTNDPANAAAWNNAAELGPAPKDRAASNRMSPAGIVMFYGSDDVDTAVAEIGGHGDERYAVVGKFQTLRDLTLIDLTDLPPVPSLYTEAGRTRHAYELRFLHDFTADLTPQVTLDDREHIEYVPTQVVAEYLRRIPEQHVDGILFRSSRNGTTCCVLFCDSTNCVDSPAPAADASDDEHLPAEHYLQLVPRSVRLVPTPATL